MMDEREKRTLGVIKANNAASPIGRMAIALEVAEVAEFFLSYGASAVSGAIVPVDGGDGARDRATHVSGTSPASSVRDALAKNL